MRLDDQLLADAKRLAAETGRTLTAVIEDALRQSLSHRNQKPAAEPVRLISHGQGGLRPGVNLDNSADLLELMQETDDPG